eukprot:TRINITY_DN10207_c0_g1_i2.p1 TRINITY_DN10207_c0_g1~~TRINITY_DN10207_c0_g1_i2.p1  ORF type:complete len:190 (-),score=30.66 TRINITY_DN10207_c0_g1_i2:56-625(-)
MRPTKAFYWIALFFFTSFLSAQKPPVFPNAWRANNVQVITIKQNQTYSQSYNASYDWNLLKTRFDQQQNGNTISFFFDYKAAKMWYVMTIKGEETVSCDQFPFHRTMVSPNFLQNGIYNGTTTLNGVLVDHWRLLDQDASKWLDFYFKIHTDVPVRFQEVGLEINLLNWSPGPVPHDTFDLPEKCNDSN